MRILLLIAFALALAALAPLRAAHAEDEGPKPVHEVQIEVAGGAKIAADVYEPKGGGETRPVVIALHGEGGDRTSWKPVAERLAKSGITCVVLEMKAAEGAPPPWPGATDAALAAVRWARGTLLADGKKVALAGAGAGGNAAVAAARKDTGVAAVLVLGPLPGAAGIDAGVVSWDERPIALVAGAKSPQLGELRKMSAPIAKRARAETILVDGAAGHGAELLAASPDAVLEVAQWLRGWLERPVLDGKLEGMDPKESQGGGHVVLSQSSIGAGIGRGGGVSVTGYRAPQEVDGFGVLADSNPKATALSATSRRLTIVPVKGAKEPRILVKVERWGGKSWKAAESFELGDCGGFGKVANVECGELWLPPRVLGVKPFAPIAVKACFLDKGKTTFDEDRGDFNPSAWGTYELD